MKTLNSRRGSPAPYQDILDRAFELARSCFDDVQQSFNADRRRLEEIGLEERKLIREIAKLGASDEFYTVLDELREEKDVIQSRVEASQPR